MFVISPELIPWEQMVNGGLPYRRRLELASLCLRTARSRSEVQRDAGTKSSCQETGEGSFSVTEIWC